MGKRIKICRTVHVSYPQTFLLGCLKAGIIAFTLCPQGVISIEIKTRPVNRQPVVCGDGLIFCAAAVFLTIVPILMAAEALAGSGFSKRTTELLARPPVVCGFSILIHSKLNRTQRIAGGKSFFILCATLVEWDEGFSVIDHLYGVVDAFHIAALVCKERTFP